MSVSTTILSQSNTHPRDSNIQFFEKGHQYEVKNTEHVYTSVTTWVHSHFPKFNADMIISSMMKGKNWQPGHKYWGKTADEIKKEWSSNDSAIAGTQLHYKIECFMNNDTIRMPYSHKELYDAYVTSSCTQQAPNSPEWDYFIQFVKDFPHLKPYRTEWIVYDEDVQIAGSIDMVYENDDGTLSIYDWKRTKEISSKNNYNKFAYTQCIKHIPNSNFWHYALQLNIYKTIIENKYGKTVKELFLVRLHPNNIHQTYELIKLPILEEEMQNLFEERKPTI